MRVLHFFKTYYPHSFGGVEQMIHQLANTLAPDVQSTVLSLAPPQNPHSKIKENQGSQNISADVLQDGIAYQTCYSRLNFTVASTGFSWPAIFDFKRLVKDADIIHYHFPNPFADLLHQICQVKKPTVLTYHSDIVKQKRFLKIYQPLMRKFLGQMDAIIATSEHYIQSSDVLPLYSNKLSVVPIGIQDVYQKPSLFLEHPDYIERAHYWQQKLTKPYFLFVGSLRYYKGLHLLLEAIQSLRTQNKCSEDFEFVIAGGGALMPELKAMIAREELKNIHLLGEITDLDKHILYQKSYAFTFPSHIRTEAFGISLVEAAMHGKAMLSFEMGTGSSFINQHQITGERLNLSVDILADAIYRWMQQPQQIKIWGQQARQRFLEHLQADMMAQRYDAIYQKILSRA